MVEKSYSMMVRGVILVNFVKSRISVEKDNFSFISHSF
jgi:hypothetical protein